MNTPLDRLYRAETQPGPTLVVQREAAAPSAAGSGDDTATDELRAEAAEPEHYRPFIARTRPIPAFALVEKDGTLHGFHYHTLRHPKLQVRDGNEYLSFTADGQAVVIEGKGLAILFRALQRSVLFEVREYDGKPSLTQDTHISRLGVIDPRTMPQEARTDLL